MIIENISFPPLDPKRFKFRSYKIMPRAQNAHAYVNAGFLFELENGNKIISCRICYGGINSKFVHAELTEARLNAIDEFYTNETLQKSIQSLQSELNPDWILPDANAKYRKNLAISLFYRFFLATSPLSIVSPKYLSGTIPLQRSLSSGKQSFETNTNLWPLTEPTLKHEGLIQCSGEAKYSNDIFTESTVKEELWAAFVPATEVLAKIIKIDPFDALVIHNYESFIYRYANNYYKSLFIFFFCI